MITRWNPVREMLALNNLMDRLFDSTSAARSDTVEWSLPLDVIESKEEYLVKASVPGINPDDLEITFQNNVLTIRGSQQEEKIKEDTCFHLRERRWGSFGRSLTLPSDVNAEAIQASFENGVLSLRLPKVEEAKPKRIAVQPAKMIEGKSK